MAALASFPPQVSPQHRSMLNQYHSNQRAGGGANLQDWLKAWKSWAATRKRGKMAQFIVQKLEDNKQARWLDITIGKFELTEWHNIAEEWFKEKPRSSDQVDAPCMLRKGLPRAFPGLDEVKTESIKEGTQYRSRVFRATPELVREVQMYVNKPGGSAGAGFNGTVPQFFAQPAQSKDNVFQHSYMPMSTASTINGPYSGGTPPFSTAMPNPLSSSLAKVNAVTTSDMNFNHTPNSMHSPGGGHIKLEELSPYSVQNSSPAYSTSAYVDIDVDGSPAPSESASNSSPYPTSNLTEGSGAGPMFDAEPNHSPEVNSQLISEGNGFNNGYGAAGMNGSYPYGPMLQVPTSATSAPDSLMSEWGGNNYQQDVTSSLEMATQPHPVSPAMAGGHVQPPMQQQPQALLDVKAYPDKSPLEGGGQLALLFGGQLPRGPKWLSFISQQRPEYIHQVEALEENQMALSTMIPKHDIPENVTLQVICSGQIVAQTDFMYYANAQYNSDLLFQYLVQNFPGYFPEVNGDGGMGGPPMDPSAGGAGYPGGGYYDNIPHSSYNLLLGSCRLGIEELVFATLQLPSMTKITKAQLRKAQLLCEEHNHGKLADVMQILVELPSVESRGSEGEEEETVLTRGEAQEALAKLDAAVTPEEGGMKIIGRLRQILKMDQRSKLEEEREQQVPSSPIVQPPSPIPVASELSGSPVDSDVSPTQQRRLSSSNRLQRQDQSIREDDELTPPPGEIHSRKSIAEKDDQLPPLPLRPLPTRRQGFRKPFIATHSDAADSAVSMSFDRDGDFEQEVARRNSASLALSAGFYSSSIDGTAININIDQEAGHNFAQALQFECAYQVTEDYPPHSDSTSVIFKAGDRIIQIGDTYVRDKGPEDFAELLQTEAVKGTSVRIMPHVSPPPSSSINSSLGYSSLDASSGRSLVKKPSESQVMDSITVKVSNLLSMKGSGFRRSITLPYLTTEKSFGFRFTGGNAVGLFVTEVSLGKKELQVGDQILELAGQSAVQMSYFEALELIAQAKGTLQLKVMQNTAKYQSIRDQFEFESFYLRCDIDHTPTDTKDMTLTKGSLVRVVNSVLFSDAWLAWSVDETTGIDMELRRIPTPKKAYQQYGKLVYQPVEGPSSPVVSPPPSSPVHLAQNTVMVS